MGDFVLKHPVHEAWLVPVWVTVFGRLKHLGAEPGTQVYWAWAIPPWIGEVSTQQKLGELTGTVVLQCRLLSGWGLGKRGQHRRTGSSSALEVCLRRCKYFTLVTECIDNDSVDRLACIWMTAVADCHWWHAWSSSCPVGWVCSKCWYVVTMPFSCRHELFSYVFYILDVEYIVCTVQRALHITYQN